MRGTWPVQFSGDSPSGICTLSASLNGESLPGSTSGRNVNVWHQCAAPAVSDSIQTGDYGQGPVSLVLAGTDAAGVPVSDTKTVEIDNTTPTISLSGPTDAPSTAGPQVVTATAAGGPSGIDGISCSVDGAPAVWHAGTSASIAVAGVGSHSVRCAAAGNAVDASGNRGWSDWSSWTLSIRQPTVTAIALSRLADALVCHQAIKRTRVPGHWRTVWRHHKPVWVKTRARTRVVKITRCHARVIRRRVAVWVTVRRHGKPRRVKRDKIIRVVRLPHMVSQESERVAHGHATSVSGWLGMPDGTALAGQTVQLLAAPDNGLGQFTPITTASTAADGTWTAQIPAGPSRLIEASYPGAATLEPTTSAQVTELVPAKVTLTSITPKRVAWGTTVHIHGRLIGGYLPAGGALVRLRIGYRSAYTTYGVQEHVTGAGTFTASYTFGVGDPRLHRAYWFQIASLPMGNYPWLPAASGKATVLVGGHPRPPVKHPRRRHAKRRHQP